MSAVKILAFGVLMIEIVVAPALGGSMNSWQRGPTLSAENLAPNSNGSGSNQSGLVLGTTGTTSGTISSPNTVAISMAGTSFANGWTESQAANSSSSPTPPDAFINFGNGPYLEAASLTTGTPEAFTNSPAFTHLFGPGGPSSTDVANFEKEVLSTIQLTYNNAGLAIHLTTDPNAGAAHTMSVVSVRPYSGNADAIGITDVGNNGFSFIDKFGAAQTVDQLAVAIGHNLSHELMHAFGISNHPEQSGPYVDAATTTFQTLSDPSTGFSQSAASLLSTLNFQDVGQSVTAGTSPNVDGNQILVDASPVPEPSTLALFAMAGGLVVARRRRRAA